MHMPQLGTSDPVTAPPDAEHPDDHPDFPRFSHNSCDLNGRRTVVQMEGLL